MKFFYVRYGKVIKETSRKSVETELRNVGYDASLRKMYFERPWKLKLDSAGEGALWLVPESLISK